MNYKSVIALPLALIAGCSKPVPPVDLAVKPDFTVAEATSDMLAFHVVYTRNLTNNRALKITATSNAYLGQDAFVSFQDSLLQTNGKWAIFDCENIAERVIDTDLVSEITPLCVEGHALGKEYWEKRNYAPDEFVDTTGVHWKKVK